MADIAAALGGIDDQTLGVAVSGGGDSTALLCLAQDWARAQGRKLLAVTVDHGLRDGSAAEAHAVAHLAEALGVDHSILQWDGWDGCGNLQQTARDARINLISDWAAAHDIRIVMTGHTAEDQAETLLMRLARGSGVDGLAGMAPESSRDGILWLRPLLSAKREDLRDVLRARGVSWVEDPTNDDPRFTRVQMRQAREVLDGLGLTTERLTATAEAMGRARQALEDATLNLARQAATPHEIGSVELNGDVLFTAGDELRLRLLAHSLQWVAAATYRPRLTALSALDADIRTREAGRRTLLGCVVDWRDARLSVTRELAQIGPRVPAGVLWDGRWETEGPGGTYVGALGADGFREIPNWRDTGHSRAALEASPAFWQNDALVDAPFALPNQRCHAVLKNGVAGYFNRLEPALKTR